MLLEQEIRPTKVLQTTEVQSLSPGCQKGTRASALIPQSAGKNARELRMNGSLVLRRGGQTPSAVMKEEPNGMRLVLPGAGPFEILARY